MFQNAVCNVHFTLIKCDSPSLILQEFLDGFLLGFRQVSVQFQSIASGFCYSHPARMTSVRVSSTSIVVIYVALKSSVCYILRVLTVNTSRFLHSVYVSSVSRTLIGKVCVISGFHGVDLTLRFVATL